MAGQEDKKRKRPSNGGHVPSKRVAVEGARSGGITVTYHEPNGSQPVLLASPALTAPSTPFTSYAKALSSKHTDRTPKPATHHLLLHSSQHPRLDHIATPSSLDQHQSHYIAVFDPATQQLQITPAHHLSLRSIPRKISADLLANQQRRTFAQQREQLGQEFGTKKAKKAIASKTENAITKGGNKGRGPQSGAQSAVLESMADSAAATLTKEDAERDLLASKPIPTPNLSAETVEEVYPFNTLLPPGDARLVPVKDWQEKTLANEEIKFAHRFPAHRVSAVGKSEDISRLKALNYLSLLLAFHDALQNAGRAGKKVPKKEHLSKTLASWPDPLVDSVRRRFSNASNELPKWHMDNLYTHICALSLFVDGWMTNASDLREDLKLENKVIAQYFAELGCKVNAPTEKDRERMGVGKAQGSTMRMARLKLPLEFPKARAGRRK